MFKAPAPDDFVLFGAKRAPFRDFYHGFLQLSFPAAFLGIVAAVLTINTAFALLYLFFGGIANADPNSFIDAFSFSMQTIATIGYGAMYPQSPAAKLISDMEALSGMMVTALATGLLFTKFSQTRATLSFTRNMVITQHDGQPTLMFRIGNERGNLIVEAQARLVLTRTETTSNGSLFYRMYDLKLIRDRSVSFTRSWNLMHTISPDSPLYGLNAEDLAKQEVEIVCAVVGIDDTSLQPIHGRWTWTDSQILFSHRLKDMLAPQANGKIHVYLNHFDEVEPEMSPALTVNSPSPTVPLHESD